MCPRKTIAEYRPSAVSKEDNPPPHGPAKPWHSPYLEKRGRKEEPKIRSGRLEDTMHQQSLRTGRVHESGTRAKGQKLQNARSGLLLMKLAKTPKPNKAGIRNPGRQLDTRRQL